LAPSGTAAVPRVVLPSPMTTSAFPPPPVPLGAAPAAPAPTLGSSATGAVPANPSEPKKIRTVAIKPDGTDGNSRPAAPPPSPSAQISARSLPPAPAARTPAGRSAPLSLDPSAQAEAVEQAPPPAPARQRNAPAPARVASIAPSGSGGYMVQLSSQRSEAEAHASFRSLQGKFKELAGHEAVVRRADLGGKGTYYRAMVGPFGSAEEANHFCGGLKAAGGQCLIQKN
jgi:hypothetical protein